MAPTPMQDAQPTSRQPPPDRFLIAAIIDRLIYQNEAVFLAADARTLLEAVPHRHSPWFGFRLKGSMPGGTSQGFAAGLGSTKIKDKKDRQFSYESAADAYTRAGQWKILYLRGRRGQQVQIEQVMAEVADEGRGARINYRVDGTPTSMDLRVVTSFRLFWSPLTVVIPGWKPWKVPG